MNAVLRDSYAWWISSSTHGISMLQQAWAAAGAGLGPQDLADGSGLQIVPMAPLAGVEALLITLPPPEAPTECYFIALVRTAGQAPRYFVCERGFDGEGGVLRAYWAEWRLTPGGLMRIRGVDLPAPNAQAFLAAVAEECRATPAMPQQAPFAATKPKSRAPLFAGLGCLTFFLLVVGVGGFLLYQEEGRGLHIPDSEAASVPVEADKPFQIQFKWDGTGYAFNNIWLVVDEGTMSGGQFAVSGTMACGRSALTTTPDAFKAELSGRAGHNVEKKGAAGFSGWLYLKDEYEHSSSSPISCVGTIKPVQGTWTKARIVVTQRQRPSDWFAN